MTRKNKMPRSVEQLETREIPTTWILLMQRGKAKLMKQTGVNGPLEFIEGFVNPAGDLQNRELVTDRPGRFDRTNGSGYASTAGEDAHEHSLTSFAKALADTLEAGVVRGECGHLVIAAEPHCLGRLKGELRDNSRKCLRAAIPKDLFHISGQELAAKLDESV